MIIEFTRKHKGTYAQTFVSQGRLSTLNVSFVGLYLFRTKGWKTRIFESDVKMRHTGNIHVSG